MGEEKKTYVILVHSGEDALGADQVILGTDDGTNLMAVPNGTVVISTDLGDSDWWKVRLFSDLEMEPVYALHEAPAEYWWVSPDDVKKRWAVSKHVFETKLVPKWKGVVPEPLSPATESARDKAQADWKARNP